MKFLQACYLALLTSLLLATQASGAVITWAASAVNTDTSNASQISTDGSLFLAVDVNSGFTSTSYTVNGVTFTASNAHVTIGNNLLYPTSSFGTPAPGTGTYTYASILDGAAGNAPDSASPSNPIHVTGLTPNQTYQLQLWTPYWNFNYATRFSDVAPTGPDYLHALNESPSVNVGKTGTVTSQYILGTFTADLSGVQNIYYYGGDATFSAGLIGALQIRAVPEPSTVALLAIGGLVLIVRSRIRQRKLAA